MGGAATVFLFWGFVGALKTERWDLFYTMYQCTMYVHIFHNIVCECGDCEASDICPLIDLSNIYPIALFLTSS